MYSYWAYIHSEDRHLHVKRDFEYPGGLSDYEAACYERNNGNSFIWFLLPPLAANNINEAEQRFINSLYNRGFTFTHNRWEGERWKEAEARKSSRFDNIDLE